MSDEFQLPSALPEVESTTTGTAAPEQVYCIQFTGEAYDVMLCTESQIVETFARMMWFGEEDAEDLEHWRQRINDPQNWSHDWGRRTQFSEEVGECARVNIFWMPNFRAVMANLFRFDA